MHNKNARPNAISGDKKNGCDATKIKCVNPRLNASHLYDLTQSCEARGWHHECVLSSSRLRLQYVLVALRCVLCTIPLFQFFKVVKAIRPSFLFSLIIAWNIHFILFERTRRYMRSSTIRCARMGFLHLPERSLTHVMNTQRNNQKKWKWIQRRPLKLIHNNDAIFFILFSCLMFLRSQ